MTTRPVLPIGSDPIVGDVEYLHGLRGDDIARRDAVVWLPPSYCGDRDRRYPVLYMKDGHNVVDPATSYAGVDWAVDEIATQMIETGRIREFILVAPYAGEERFEEYGYTDGGRAYLRFLTGTLKPMIDERYRTLPGRDDTFTMGSSMGGLISLLALWWHPDVFSGAGCLSPYFPDELVADIEESSGWPPDRTRIYLDNGDDELDESFQPNIDALLEILDRLGFGDDVTFVRDSGAPHHESAWSHRVWRPLEFLLGR
jgi:predicted alpha/beta superfamily hydrolase